MTSGCEAPIADEVLIDYWSGDLPATADAVLEEHLFACGGCTARLASLASLAAGIATLVRRGRVSGGISRALFNRMQRDGVHIRFYALGPSESVPCAVFPGDDLVVVSLRADLEGVRAVTLSIAGSAGASMDDVTDMPVSGPEGEVLWATPATTVRQLPSTRLRLTLTATGGTDRVLGEYMLDHTAPETPT